jgi:hypothetical protein
LSSSSSSSSFPFLLQCQPPTVMCSECDIANNADLLYCLKLLSRKQLILLLFNFIFKFYVHAVQLCTVSVLF